MLQAILLELIMRKIMDSILTKIINRSIYFFINVVKLKIRRVKTSSNINIRGILKIRNNGSISIGNKVYLISGQKYSPIGGDDKFQLWVGKDAELIIGDRVGIANTTIVSFQKVIIENDVLIGGGCKIYDTDFHPLNAKDRIIGSPKSLTSNSKEVKICSGVFIGGHSIILKGVTVGNNSIIGAGSVVTKNIPANEIWAGNPAKFVKKIGSE